jgi:menaquinol-cytochrome c reductase iron-sulfur subunit
VTEDGANRRGFLKGATLGVGGIMTVAVVIPFGRTLLHPVGKSVVSSAEEPIDVMAAADLAPGGPPVRVQLFASKSRDAWSTAKQTALGSAYLQKQADGEIICFTSVCPHLGCAIGYDASAKNFACPCHKSAFALTGEKLAGPSKRGLDPLPVSVKDGRILITFRQYRADIAERVEM